MCNAILLYTIFCDLSSLLLDFCIFYTLKSLYFKTKEKRKELGFTQEQVATELNISLGQYVRIDNKEDLPRRSILNKLISLYKLSDNEIGKYIRSITQKIA